MEARRRSSDGTPSTRRKREKPDAILIVVGALLARLTVLLALSLPLFRMSGFSGWSILALQLVRRETGKE